MGAKGEALAKSFEAKAAEAAGVIEKVGDADWKKMTAAEQWPVGVVAHHIAEAHATIGGIMKRIADGTNGPPIAMDDIHALNAKHAKDHAGCTKSETLALHRTNAASTAAMLGGLDDAQLARAATVLVGLPVMTVEQLAGGLLLGHVDEHLGNIRATLRG